MIGRLNLETGNPELASAKGHTALATAGYHGVAAYFPATRPDKGYLCFGSYWEGEIPLSWIGVALEVKIA